MMSYERERHAKIRGMAAQAFAEHKLTREGEGGRYFAGKPGDSAYHFRLVFSPGAVFLHGDIGELVLCPVSARDSLAWLRGSVNRAEPRDGDYDYVLGKIPGALTSAFREFSRECALEIVACEQAEKLREIADEAHAAGCEGGEHELDERTEDALETLREAARVEDSDPTTAWDSAWQDYSPGNDVPDPTLWSSRTVFMFEALRWFVRELDRLEAPPAPAGEAAAHGA